MSVIQAEPQARGSAFHDLSSKTTPLVALAGCDELHQLLSSRLSEHQYLGFTSLTVKKLSDLLLEKSTKASDIDPGFSCLNLKVLRNHVSLPAVIAFCFELTNQSVRSVEGDVVELDGALLRQIEEIRSSNQLKRNLKLVIVGIDRATSQTKRWKEIKSHSDVKQMIFFEQDTENSLKRLEKILIDSAKDYYEQKRDRAKKNAELLKKMTPQQSILAELKIAFMGEALRDTQCALKYFISAYQSVCKLEAEAKQHEELTSIAEFLNFKLCNVLLESSLEDAFTQTLQQFEFHIRHFKPIVLHSDRVAAGEQFAWVSRQYELFAELLVKLERYDLAHQPWHYFETAASYLVKKRLALRSKLNQENTDPRSPGPSASPVRDREANQRSAVSAKILELLAKAYSQAKGLPCSQRIIWQLASRMGDEYLFLRQYAKAVQMYDRILESYMKEGYQWWPLFAAVTRKSMACATRLQLTEDVVKKSFLLLPAGNQLDDYERKQTLENMLSILKHQHPTLPRLKEPVLYEAAADDSLLPCRILLLTNLPKLQVNLLITSKLPLPLEFSRVSLLHKEHHNVKLISNPKPAPPLVLQPGVARSFKFNFEVQAVSDLQDLCILLEVGDSLRVSWHPSQWPREHIGSATYVEEEAVMVEIPSAEFTVHEEEEETAIAPPAPGTPNRKLTREKSNYTLRLGSHLVPLYRNRTLLSGLTDNEAKKLQQGLDSIVHEEETIELGGSSLIPNASAPLSRSVSVSEHSNAISSTCMFSGIEVLQDVLNAFASRRQATSLVLSNSFLNDKMLARFVPALARCAPQLREIDLSHSHLDVSALTSAANGLRSFAALQVISLASNRGLGDEGARLVAEVLSSATTLHTLDLSITGIGAAGAASLCSALAVHPTLTELKMACNPIGDDGARSFTELFKVNSTLRKIDLRASSIGFNGAKLFATVLSRLPALVTSLNLRDNDITKHGHRALSEAIRSNFVISELSDDKELILPLLARNVEIQKLISARTTSVRLPDRAMFSIPPVLLQLVQTKELDVRGNRIDALPRDLVNMRDLEELVLANNALTAAVLNWASFDKLRHIDLSENQLVELPADIFAVKSLQYLYARKNHIVNLNERVCNLAQLLVLDVGYNAISSLPEQIGQLAKLKTLNLEGNQLTALPAGILPLQFTVEHLNLRNNTLQMLPPELAHFRGQGAKVTFEGNPLGQLPPEIVRRGENAVLSFLSDLISGSEKCTRLKLMLVGQENVGKTTLLKVLRQGASVRNKFVSILTGKGVRSSTEGIDIEDWSPTEGLTLSAWDFGGQEVYYNTHEFFLSQRSIFLLIFNMAENVESSRLVGWLNSIQSRAPGASVILVGTNADNKICTKQHFSNLQAQLQQIINRWRLALDREKSIVIDQAGPDGCWFQQVSCIKGTGFESLEKKIVETSLKQPCMQEKIPRTYMRLLEMVKQVRSTIKCPLLSWKELRDWNVIADEEKLRRAAQLLHDWGEILYFGDSPQLRNLVILNPQWLTKFLATIVTHKREGQMQAYLIHKETLPQMWRDYPVAFHSALEDLLVKFEVWAQVPGTDTFLVPCLFPKDANSENWMTESKDLLGRCYTMPFGPRGFFPRLLTRVLRFSSAKKYWSNGAIVAASYDRSSQAYLELRNQRTDDNPYQCALQIIVKGSASGKLLRQLVFTIQGFLQDWYSGLRGKVHVSVLCPSCLVASGSNSRNNRQVRTFNFENFLTKYLDAQKKVGATDSITFCDYCKLNVPIQSMIPEVIEGLDSGDYATHVKEIQPLGSGSFAHVVKAIWNGHEVAVKKMRTDSISVDMFEEFCHEMSLMRHLDHPNIVRYYTSFAQPLALVLELVKHGALDDVLRAMTGPHNWPMLTMIASDVAKGMMYLHNHNPAILHRDLKGANILVSELTGDVCHVKIADLGLSCLHTGHAGRVVDNPRWLAPETLAQSVYTDKSDIYSFGMVMWELIGRKLPFDEAKWDHDVEERVKRGERPAIPADTREDFDALLKLCWDQDAARRPAFGTIVLKLAAIERAVRG